MKGLRCARSTVVSIIASPGEMSDRIAKLVRQCTELIDEERERERTSLLQA
jgi:hypothetical protein